MQDFTNKDVSAQDWPGPMVRLRAIPLIADLKELGLRAHPPPTWRRSIQFSAVSLSNL